MDLVGGCCDVLFVGFKIVSQDRTNFYRRLFIGDDDVIDVAGALQKFGPNLFGSTSRNSGDSKHEGIRSIRCGHVVQR